MRLAYLVHFVPSSNKHRFYPLIVTQGLFGEWALVREWGRVGASGKVRSDWYSTEAAAVKAGRLLQKQKIKKGYIIVE